MTTNAPAQTPAAHSTDPWSPTSWQAKLEAQQIRYEDREAVERAKGILSSLPPLVTSYEIERLKEELAQAHRGERFILQGGDCAESIDDCRSEVITAKLKILLQMSVVLVHGLKKPVTRIGRIAGQYAKPRSSPTEKVVIESPEGPREVELPSYFGDLVNRAEPDEEARRPDPFNMIRGYQHAALTLNFIRSLLDGGFADMHHPGDWDLRFTEHAGLTPDRREQYDRMVRSLADALRFMEALGDSRIHELDRAEFFTSHEGLNLIYESAQTRRVPRRSGWYDLTTHLPWIGERTRGLEGSHVEYFRGISNPVGVKVGPKAPPEEVVELIRTLNPADEPGKILLIARCGAVNVTDKLPPLIDAVAASGSPVVWVCDPMHGNGIKTQSGIKTRSFDNILEELEHSIDIHRLKGTWLGGVHFELTGEDVTECLGGARGLSETDLATNYASRCDPRLNYEQAMELAFLLAAKISARV